MTTELTASLLIGLGTMSLCLGLGIAGLSRLLKRRPIGPQPRPWKGTLARVCARIPDHGIGRVVHHRAGMQASLPATMFVGDGVDEGCEVVVIEVRRGLAYVARVE